MSQTNNTMQRTISAEHDSYVLRYKLRIACIGGDGIGPEVLSASLPVFEKAGDSCGLDFEWEHKDWGAERWLSEGVGLPCGAIEDLRQGYDAILFGALGDPRIPDMAHGREILLGLRRELDLYANVRPVQVVEPEACPLKNSDAIDFVVVRENTEGLYSGLGESKEIGTPNEVSQDVGVNTYRGVKRIVDYAAQLARVRDSRVTVVDKNNAMKFGGSIWQRVMKEAAAEYPDVGFSHLYADVAAMHLVSKPQSFDVLVAGNLFGDILSDIGAAVMGSLGLAASANIHPEKLSLFEPVHGSAPDISGKGIANPLAMMMSGAMMFDELGFPGAAKAIRDACVDTLEKGPKTPDLGGSSSTREVADAVVGLLS